MLALTYWLATNRELTSVITWSNIYLSFSLYDVTTTRCRVVATKPKKSYDPTTGVIKRFC